MTNQTLLTSLLLHLIAFQALYVLLLSAIWAVTIIAIYQCLTSMAGVDRLTWLIALIALPIIGLIIWFIAGQKEARNFRVVTEDDLYLIVPSPNASRPPVAPVGRR